MVGKKTKRYRLNRRKFAAFILGSINIAWIAYFAICYAEVLLFNTQGANYSAWNIFAM